MSKSNVSFNVVTCFLCKKSHNDSSSTVASNSHHFHCFICDNTIQRRIDFEKHLCKCWKECGYPAFIASTGQNPSSDEKSSTLRGSAENVNKSKPTIEQNGICQLPPNAERNQTRSHQTEKEQDNYKTVRKVQEMVTCDICKMKIQRCSLKRHLRTKHKNDITIHGICVDSASALYMVRKTTNGLNFPCHVQKQTCGAEQNKVMCEMNDCISASEIAFRSGYKSFECQHLERACISYLITSNRLINN